MTKIFTPEEAKVIRILMKDGIDVLHAERRKAAEGTDMMRLLKVEEQLSHAESAWQKIKEML